MIEYEMDYQEKNTGYTQRGVSCLDIYSLMDMMNPPKETIENKLEIEVKDSSFPPETLD